MDVAGEAGVTKDEWIWRCQLCGARFPHVEWHSYVLVEHAHEHRDYCFCRDGKCNEIFDEVNAYEDLLERLAG